MPKPTWKVISSHAAVAMRDRRVATETANPIHNVCARLMVDLNRIYALPPSQGLVVSPVMRANTNDKSGWS